MKITLVPRGELEPQVTNAEACKLCGSAYHEDRHCKILRSTEPVRRRWGYPGWEGEEPERAAMFAAAATEPNEDEKE